jgi:hypothetical protein
MLWLYGHLVQSQRIHCGLKAQSALKLYKRDIQDVFLASKSYIQTRKLISPNRKALWDEIDAYVEVWLEKDALSGVVLPVTSMYDVPLMVARGYASLSFLHSAAEYINELSVPTYIYHLGDFDPSGVNAGEKIEETLREMAPDADITFERIAVTPDQIAAWNLPSRPTKTTDSRAKNFRAESVELDAIEPDLLRGLVREVIEDHLPPHQFRVLKAAEESERELLTSFVKNIAGEEEP